MLNCVSSGPEPAVEILRAIRHAVAAGACSVAARETGDAQWCRVAQDQREKATAALHHASAFPARVARRCRRRASAREESSS